MTTTTAEPTALTRTWLPVAAGAFTLVCWASAFVAIRHLGHEVTPGALTIARLGIASIVLGLIVARRPRIWPNRREWPLLVLCGVMWFGIYNLALNEAERRIDAGTAAMLIQIGPVLTLFLASIFLGERLTRWVLIGIAIGFSGVAIIGLASSNSGSQDVLGVALTVLAAITYAIGVVSQKPLTRRLHPFTITFLACVIGLLTATPFTGEFIDLVQHGSGSSWLWLVYLGVFPTAMAFSTWAYALSHMDAGKLSITTFLVPVLAILLSAFFLSETPPGLAYVGGALCVVGVLISRRKVASPEVIEEVPAR
ncbi:drug/metabolite transporter (DMT)-like permease [Nocardioides daedukensis]|uniref:Drug/metabolite transporter (DMT)-like permease n=1 Tax=Nocardioides daedukensis TaxID=634462 RepID=A0A7Y9UPT9_9ACTN|nr:drug/metabolite transporter (DMT)-like permease [Nocardioides daedukensis]